VKEEEGLVAGEEESDTMAGCVYFRGICSVTMKEEIESMVSPHNLWVPVSH
jgi:hypothetical protein